MGFGVGMGPGLGVGEGVGLDVAGDGLGTHVGTHSAALHALTPTQQKSFSPSQRVAAPFTQKVSGEHRSMASFHEVPQKMWFSALYRYRS